MNKCQKEYVRFCIINIAIIFTIFAIMLISMMTGANQVNKDTTQITHESQDIHVVINEPTTPVVDKQEGRNLSEDDKYMLAKIAMAEAEGESLYTKILVILTVLNRVEADEFPDTIEEVIFQNYDGIYQFSPAIPGGRWWTTEPNDECWEAVEIVNQMENDVSEGALYFEACSGESWHSRNLEFICESDNTRFYK